MLVYDGVCWFLLALMAARIHRMLLLVHAGANWFLMGYGGAAGWLLVSTGSYSFMLGPPGISCVLLGVLLGPAGFYWVPMGPVGFHCFL